MLYWSQNSLSVVSAHTVVAVTTSSTCRWGLQSRIHRCPPVGKSPRNQIQVAHRSSCRPPRCIPAPNCKRPDRCNLGIRKGRTPHPRPHHTGNSRRSQSRRRHSRRTRRPPLPRRHSCMPLLNPCTLEPRNWGSPAHMHQRCRPAAQQAKCSAFSARRSTSVVSHVARPTMPLPPSKRPPRPNQN